MNRGLILGIDGLDYTFVESNLDSFPAIRAMTEEGVWGSLRSTIPPLTAPAWTTGLSGMNPGKTGITNFVQGQSKEYSEHLVDSRDVRAPRVWDVVGSNGGESVVIGAPITFPAAEVDGAMIAGLRTPALGDSAVYPSGLIEDLPSDYEFFISYSDFGASDSDELLEQLYASTNAKFDLLERILFSDIEHVPTDPQLVCFVLSESDWIQHYFLKHPEHPRYEEGERTVREYLSHVDARIDQIFSRVDDRAVAVLSDHGFGKRITKHVYINELLVRKGFLHLSKEGDTLQRFIGRNLRNVAKIPGFQYLKDSIPKGAKKKALSMSELSEERINWDDTVATFRMVGNNVGTIDLHIPGATVNRRKQTRSQIYDALAEVADPDSGDPVIEEIFTKEELYQGPAADEAGDIMFLFKQPYSGVQQVGVDSIVREIPRGGRPGVCHRMDGFYSIVGEGVAAGRRIDADITDFAPTFYHILGVPLPEDVDGSVLSDALVDPIEVRYRRYDSDKTFKIGTDDTGEIEDRLENLGYL